MKDISLVIMAAGMGSRFGGLKQATPISDEGYFIIDYSIYDAIKSGIKRVVFVIKKENLELMKETIGKRLEGKIEVCYAFQELDDIPTSKVFKDRVKPWGTVQAVLCARKYVKGDFIVINADDFYGYNAYKNAVEFLNNNNEDYNYASIAYEFIKSTTGTNDVKRGVLKLNNDIAEEIIESKISFVDDKIIAYPLNNDPSFEINKNTLVSMNMFAFKYDVFNLLEEYFKEFFEGEVSLTSEALLPQCIFLNIKKGIVKLHAVDSQSTWLGMTYKEDLEFVKDEIKKLEDKNMYPHKLW